MEVGPAHPCVAPRGSWWRATIGELTGERDDGVMSMLGATRGELRNAAVIANWPAHNAYAKIVLAMMA